MPEYRFNLTHIFSHESRVFDSVLVRKHTGQRKPIFIGNKAKERISKWVLQENKVGQIFRKMYVFVSEVRNVGFSENFVYFVFLLPLF